MSLVSVAGAFGAKENSDHAKLLCKLSYYGIHGIISDWFESYLTDRTQTTQVEASISTKGKILFGVPQGSILGPLLFLIYINDTSRVSSKLNFYLFADDKNILYAINNLKSLESVKEQLRKVCEWLNTNKLSLNTSKSNFVVFHPFQGKPDYNVTIKKYHTDYTSSKICKGVAIIARLRHFVPTGVLS